MTDISQKHTKKTSKIVGSRGLTVPGYNYLGPGNSVIYTDAIAPLHNIAYRASSPAYIRKADQEIIGEFYHELRESRTPGAYLGLEGLLDTYSVETITGVLYPSTFDGGDPMAMYKAICYK